MFLKNMKIQLWKKKNISLKNHKISKIIFCEIFFLSERKTDGLTLEQENQYIELIKSKKKLNRNK